MAAEMLVSNIKELFSKRVLDAENTVDIDVDTSKILNIGHDEDEEISSLDKIVNREIVFGITQYASSCTGFEAVIKQRYSDFHVHEIDQDGNIVKLTNMDIPPEPHPTKPENTEHVLECGKLEELTKLVNGTLDMVEIDVTIMEKEKRKQIHLEIKEKYGSAVISNTIDGEGVKKIVVKKRVQGGKNDDRWPANLPQYLHFALFKSHTDTIEAVNILAYKLRTKAAHITYAGTKDKRAVTTQNMCMRFLKPERLISANKSMKYMKVGNFCYKPYTLRLGCLKGNLFQIVLRNILVEDSVIDLSISFLKQHGFINYYGLQRFGKYFDVPTHLLGKELIKGNFQSAVEMILKPRNEESRPELANARKIWWETRKAEPALLSLTSSKEKTIEGKLLSGLNRHGSSNFSNALDSLPRSIILLYLHAFQSFIWNRIVSKRIEKYGKKVLEGDLVFLGNESDLILEVDENPEEAKIVNNSKVPKQSVVAISSENINDYTIFDVVYPLPGHSVVYPENEIKNWYDEELKEHDLAFDSFSKNSSKKYCLSGNYRHIMKKVDDLEYFITHYTSSDENLILSDEDCMNNVAAIDRKPSGPYKAIVLKFSLDPCCYATMVLRELLKVDTSCTFQKSLNSYESKRKLDEDDIDGSKKLKADHTES